MAGGDFKITAALICDDLRMEVGGKSFFIGVYGNSIIFPAFPVTFAFVACLLGKVTGDFSLEVVVEAVSEKGDTRTQADASANVKITNKTKHSSIDFMLPIKVEALPLEGPGEIVVKARLKGKKRWEKICTKDVLMFKSAPI